MLTPTRSVMDRRTRIAFFVTAIVIAVVALIVLRPSDDEEEAASPRPVATATDDAQDDTSPTPTPEPTPEPLPLLTAEKVRRMEVKQGETVRFEVRSAEADEVHVHGYDISKEVPAGRKIRMSFEADITGIFEIELEQSGTPIGELEVRP